MKIVFSEHAQERNSVRKIPQKYIIETVKSPEQIIPSFKARQLRRKTFDDKILEVVVVTEEQALIIITQYWLDEEDL